MTILDLLQDKKEGPRLVDCLKHVREVAAIKLQHTRDLFPHFTDHTISHSDQVLELLDNLVPDDVKKSLNAWELYFLVAATYLHDIGMVEGCPGSPSGTEWDIYLADYLTLRTPEEKREHVALVEDAKREFIRSHHHERSEEYIANRWVELRLTASGIPAEGQIVARIAAGHRKMNLGDANLFGPVAFGTNQWIHRDLLAAYLRLADELDTTAYRTPWAEFEVLSIEDADSQMEWSKHLSISGVAFTAPAITLSGRCTDHRVFLRLNQLKIEIQGKLLEMRDALGRPYYRRDTIRIDDPLPYRDVILSLEHIGYLALDIRFELQHDQIMNLLMGTRLYRDGTACIRELLQNAVDTCREAREIRPADWEPQINVEVNVGTAEIIVSDNGMGIDESIVKEYVARIGSSYYTSKSFRARFRPVSEFGIGLLSCFMLADRVIIDSKRQDSQALTVEMTSATENLILRPSVRDSLGTEVRLHLKKEIQPNVQWVAWAIRRFARQVTFPIEVRANGLPEFIITDSGYRPLTYELNRLNQTDQRMVALHTSMEPINCDGIEKMHCEIETDELTVGVTLLDNFIPPNPQARSNVKTSAGTVCNSGFFVRHWGLDDNAHENSRYSHLDPNQNIWSNAWWIADIKNSRDVQTTVDRFDIVGDIEQFFSKLAEAYGDAIEQLYDKSTLQKTDQNWWSFHLNHYSLSRPDTIPAALLSAIKTQSRFCVVDATGYSVKSLQAIEECPKRLYWIPRSVHGSIGRLLDKIPDDALGVVDLHSSLFVYPGKTKGTLGRISNDYQSLWSTTPLQGKTIGTYPEFLALIDVKLVTEQIGGDLLLFVDAGRYLGSWMSGLVGDHEGIDVHHRFSQFLINTCQDELSEFAGYKLSQLLSPHRWHLMGRSGLASRVHPTSEDFHVLQRALFDVLKREAIINPEEGFPEQQDWETATHQCPYGD